MTDKEKIRAEIERSIEEEQRIRREKEKITGVGSIIDTRYESLLSYIDSMQEESVSKDLELAAKTYAKKKSHGYEPCNIVEIFKAGAKWQQEQFEKNRIDACDRATKEEIEREQDFCEKIILGEHRQPTFSDAIEYGIKWQKEQMMKNATEAEYWDNWLILDPYLRGSFADGDKVKMIIIKEDEQ